MPDHTKQDHLPSCCFYQFFFSRLHRRNSSQSRLHLCFIYCFDLLLPRSAEVAEVPSNFGKGVVINSSHFRHQAVFIAGNWSSSPSILQEWRNVLGASAMTFLLLIFIKIVETVYHLSEKKETVDLSKRFCVNTFWCIVYHMSRLRYYNTVFEYCANWCCYICIWIKYFWHIFT